MNARESEAASFLRQALEGAVAEAPFGVMCVAAAEGRYLFINEAYARLLGRSYEEELAADPFQSWRSSTYEEDFERERAEVERIARGEANEFYGERRLRRPDGTERWVSVRFTASRDASGRLQRMTGYFKDNQAEHEALVAQQSLQAELERTRELEASARLAGGLAHDFNNRLLVIMGHAELIRSEAPTGSALAEHADTVLQSATRAAELTRQLLAYGRGQVLLPRPFALDAQLENMRSLLQRLVGEHVQLIIVSDSHHAAFCDAGQVEQVILNLVLNARDAMPLGGRLTFRTRDEVVTTARATLGPGAYVVLEVSDTGTGIPRELLPRIFEPFFTTKAVGKGTGLGLASVQGMVRQSGGDVLVASELGHGTTFTVYLPRAVNAEVATGDLARPERSSDETAGRPERAQGTFETVMVVDDDPEVLDLIVGLLVIRGYQVLQAAGGRAALAKAAEHQGPIQLLVSDVMMPEMTGVQLAQRLRKARPELRVLYISGYSEDTTFMAGVNTEDTRLLSKPFLPADFTRTVCAMLEAR